MSAEAQQLIEQVRALIAKEEYPQAEALLRSAPADRTHWKPQENDEVILFTYRLLVQAGYLDDDIGAEEPAGNSRVPRRIVVHDDLCIGCYACREVCPASAIRVWDGLGPHPSTRVWAGSCHLEG